MYSLLLCNSFFLRRYFEMIWVFYSYQMVSLIFINLYHMNSWFPVWYKEWQSVSIYVGRSWDFHCLPPASIFKALAAPPCGCITHPALRRHADPVICGLDRLSLHISPSCYMYVCLPQAAHVLVPIKIKIFILCKLTWMHERTGCILGENSCKLQIL